MPKQTIITSNRKLLLQGFFFVKKKCCVEVPFNQKLDNILFFIG